MFFLIYYILGSLIINIYSYEVIFNLLCESQCQNILIENNIDPNNIITYNYLYTGYNSIDSSSIKKFPIILTAHNIIHIQVLGNNKKPGICGFVTVDGYEIKTNDEEYWSVKDNSLKKIEDHYNCNPYTFLTIEGDINLNENETVNFVFNIPPNLNNDIDYTYDNKDYYLTRNNDNGNVEISINLYELISPNYNGKLYIKKDNFNNGKVYLNNDQLLETDGFLDYNSEIKYIYETDNWEQTNLNNWETLIYSIYEQKESSQKGIITFKICGDENCNLCHKDTNNNVKCNNNFNPNTVCGNDKYYYFDENNEYHCYLYGSNNCKKINYGTRECVSSCKYPYSYEYNNNGKYCYKYCPENYYTIEENKKCVLECPIYINNHLIEYINENQNESNLLRKNKLKINNIDVKNKNNSLRIISDSIDGIIYKKKTCVAELPFPYYKVINKNEYVSDCVNDYFYYSKEDYLCTDNCSNTDHPLFNNVTKENNDKYNYCVKECDLEKTFQLGNVCHETCPYYINIEKDSERKLCVMTCNGLNFIHNEINKYCEPKCEHYLYISNSYQYYCMEKCEDNQFKYIKSQSSNTQNTNDNNEDTNNDNTDENNDETNEIETCEECFCYDSCKKYSKYYHKNKKECVDKCEDNEYINHETYECSDCTNGYIYNNFCYKECPNGTYYHLNLNDIEKKCIYPCPSDTYISLDEKSCVFSCGENQQNNGTNCLCSGNYYKNETNNKCVLTCDVFGYMRLEEKKMCVKECPIYYKKENKTQSTLIDCVYSCEPDFPYLSEDFNECLKKCPSNLYKKVDNNLICTTKLKEAEDPGKNNKNINLSLIILLPISGILIITLIILILKRKCKKKLIESQKKKIKKNKNKKQNINDSDISTIRSKKDDKNSNISNSNYLINNKV